MSPYRDPARPAVVRDGPPCGVCRRPARIAPGEMLHAHNLPPLSRLAHVPGGAPVCRDCWADAMCLAPQPVPQIQHPPASADSQQHGDDGEDV